MNTLLQPVEITPMQPALECELTVLMPCLNEAETLGTCTKKAMDCIARLGLDAEVLIADNGSTDGSQEIATSLGARVVQVPVRGYGGALAGGIQAARGRYVIMADADDSYDFGNLEPFVLELRKGYDLVMGNRFKGGVMPGAMPPLHRYLGNPVLTAIGRIFFRSPCGDFHCGMRGFSRDAVQRMDLRTTGMEFASEMVVKATIMRMKITEVPTVLSPDGRSRPPHLRTWRDGWRHLRFLLLYSPRFLFLFPGLLLALSGLILGTLIVPGPLHVGRIVLDVHTMLFASAAVLLGTQGIYFWLFVKVFAISERLLPIDNRLERLFKVLTLESGLITGGLLFFAGLALAFRAVGVWGAGDFGQLDPERVMRLAIPATMLMVLGLQIVLSSFFLSVLNLRRR